MADESDPDDNPTGDTRANVLRLEPGAGGSLLEGTAPVSHIYINGRLVVLVPEEQIDEGGGTMIDDARALVADEVIPMRFDPERGRFVRVQ